MIPFNKPYLTGKEISYIENAAKSLKLSGNGAFTQRCQQFLQDRYGFKKCLLTTSCTDALEMCAILANISPGDEVIVPSYTFVSTALAFVRQGATIVFADSCDDNPNLDANKLETLITPKTKAIVPVHYAGIACDMDKIMELAQRHNLVVIEDAAQGIESFYKGQPLGSIGHLAAFSFHETKNVISGEGGLLAINDDRFIARSEIIWEKGTNRAAFFRGSVDKYGWVDVGSSFLPSEIIAAFLWAQLEQIDQIQSRRVKLWENYYSMLSVIAESLEVELPIIPSYATNNGHMFYLVCKNLEQRQQLLAKLKSSDIHAVFHYLSLHKSAYFDAKYIGCPLANADRFTDCLVRLPLFFDLTHSEQQMVVQTLQL